MKPFNNKKEEGPLTLGQRLKKAREDSGFTLKKFAEISKIQTKYLEYLEGGRYDKLPAFVYIQGFLKKYTQILNMPSDELLKQYQNEIEAVNIAKKEVVSLPSLSSPKIIITPKKIKWAAIIIVILAILGYFIYQLDYLIAPPKLVLEYPAQDLTINTSSVRISGQAEYSAKLTINGQQIFVENDGRFSQEINLSPGLNTLKIEATNRFGKISEITRFINVQ
jgi:cytoskeletal protein RodZ